MSVTTMHDWLSRLARSHNQTPETPRAETNDHGDLPETIMVTYQRIWFDYDLRDGSYTPAELQEAKLLVKPGAVLHYRLHWPGGTMQPIEVADEQESRLRGKSNDNGAPIVAFKRRTHSGHTGQDIKWL